MNQFTGHIFATHLLTRQHQGPVVHVSNEEIWPSVLLLLALLILVFVKARALAKVTRIVQSTFSNQILQQLEREEVNPFRFYAIALNLVFWMNMAFVCYKINAIYGLVFLNVPHLLQYLFFLLLFLSGFLIRILLNNLLSAFTGEKKLLSNYLINSQLINQTFGLFIMPFIILAEFSGINPLLFLGGSVLVLAIGITLKWYRGLMMGLVQERVGLLQIFSYFCGLEILPTLVLVKYLIETF